ncbi:MAG: hypothetical protein A3G24_05230 [Betaproteobacteria bacterium RIFCSPLOWO2_12_FULL_62_13]|nr:MAG: hypothetical protein A3G24_05230 [Betaproteobacteria bacterium RIFCSPLOWO2_12_FULL_62_13]
MKRPPQGDLSAIGTILGVAFVAAFLILGVLPFLVRKLSEARILTNSVFIAALAFTLLPLFVNPYSLAAPARHSSRASACWW